MKNNSIKVFAPASVSNVGPGFDLMGFALEEPGDEIIIKQTNANGIKINKISGDKNKLPLNPKLNTTTVAVKSLLNSLNVQTGLSIEIRKKMGIGSGLGSSAASSVAGVYAVNKLLNLKQSKDKLLKHAIAGEMIASGSLHADNVAPCLYGGFILIRSYNPIDIVKIQTPKKLYCSIVYPDIIIKTSDARKMIKRTVQLKNAIAQAGNSAGLIAGMISGDYNLIRRSIKCSIAEPTRAELIPCYNDIRTAAINNGALNCNITGSGPSMFAFSTSKEKAISIAEEMKKAVTNCGYKSKTYVSRINKTGPKVL